MPSKSVTVTMYGKSATVTESDVLKAARLPPAPVRRHGYYVVIGNVRHPIRQLVARAAGVPHISVLASTAYTALTALGFMVYQART